MSTFLLDWLKPKNPPDGLWRGDEASSAYPLQLTLPLLSSWPATPMSRHTQKCYTDHSDKANTRYLTPLHVQLTASTRRAPCWARTPERAGQGCPPPPLAASFPSGNQWLSPPFQSQLLTRFLTLSSHLGEVLLSPRGQPWRWVCFGRAVALIMKYFARQSMLTPCFTTIWLNFPLHQI